MQTQLPLFKARHCIFKRPDKIRPKAGLPILTLGVGLLVSSFIPDILRNGYAPIAALISSVGIFAIIAGWICIHPRFVVANEGMRVRLCLLFEHLALIAIFGIGCMISVRHTYFASPPSGGNMDATLGIMTAAFGVLALLSLIVRFSLAIPFTRQPPPKRQFPLSGASMASFGIALGLLILLNILPRQDGITISNWIQVNITSRGFPWPRVQELQTVDVASLREKPKGYECNLPDGTLVHYDKEFIHQAGAGLATNNHNLFLVLPGFLPKQFDARLTTVIFRDKTLLQFKNGSITLNAPRGAARTFEPSTPISFPDGTLVRYEKEHIAVLLSSSQEVDATILPDRSEVRFDKGNLQIAFPDGVRIQVDVPAKKSTFASGLPRKNNHRATLLNGLVALVIAAHTMLCCERLGGLGKSD